jgi:hypothetical protein
VNRTRAHRHRRDDGFIVLSVLPALVGTAAGREEVEGPARYCNIKLLLAALRGEQPGGPARTQRRERYCRSLSVQPDEFKPRQPSRAVRSRTRCLPRSCSPLPGPVTPAVPWADTPRSVRLHDSASPGGWQGCSRSHWSLPRAGERDGNEDSVRHGVFLSGSVAPAPPDPTATRPWAPDAPIGDNVPVSRLAVY